MKERKRKPYPAYLRSADRSPIQGAPERPIILVALAIYRFPHPDTVASVWKMLGHFQGTQTDHVAALVTYSNTSIQRARSAALQSMLELPSCQAVLFIDDDMSFPVGSNPTREEPHGFNPLSHMLALQKDVVGGFAVTRGVGELKPCIGNELPDGRLRCVVTRDQVASGEPFQQDFVGFGMVLIRRHVVVGMLAEYGNSMDALFRFSSNWPKQPELLRRWEKTLEAYKRGEVTLAEAAETTERIRAQGTELMEDYSFCRRAREAGFEVWVTPRFELAHIGSYPYSVRDWEARMTAAGAEVSHESQGP